MESRTETKKEISDEEKILRQSQSDPEAFRPIYEKYFRKIFLFVLSRVGEKEIASDITQQVFLKALDSLRKFQFRGLPFSSWLYRIAVNECNDLFRRTKKARHVVLDQAAVENLHEELTADNSMEDLKVILPRILQKLTERELQFIELRFFESRPFKEIAELMGITETYAKVKTYRTLEKMKKLFLNKK